MNDPRICIVGAGGLSTRRIYPYIGAAGAQLVGVCDLDLAKAQTNARRFGGTAYTDMETMLSAQKPDAVILCIGPREHAELAVQVMRLGYSVYTEKPPAPTAAAALEVARVSLQTGLLCSTAFKKRYASPYVRAKEWIGACGGELLSISIDYASGPYPNDGSFRGEFLLDFAIHAIDLVGYLFGPARRALAFARGANAYAVSLEFENGAVGSMNLTDGRSFSIPTEEVEITARGGCQMSIHNSSCWRIAEGQKAGEWRQPLTFISAGDSGNDTGHLAEIVDFLQAVGQRRPTRSEIYESYKSMVLYEAIRSSAQSGQIIDVRYTVL